MRRFNLQLACWHKRDPRTETGDVGKRLVVVSRNLCRAEDAVVRRRMAIHHKHKRIAKRKRAPGCSVNTKITLKSADHDLFDTVLIQQVLQLSAMERIGGALPNSNIARLNAQSIGKLPTRGTVDKRALICLVLNEYDKYPRSPRLSRCKVYAFNDARGFKHFANA